MERRVDDLRPSADCAFAGWFLRRRGCDRAAVVVLPGYAGRSSVGDRVRIGVAGSRRCGSRGHAVRGSLSWLTAVPEGTDRFDREIQTVDVALADEPPFFFGVARQPTAGREVPSAKNALLHRRRKSREPLSCISRERRNES